MAFCSVTGTVFVQIKIKAAVTIFVPIKSTKQLPTFLGAITTCPRFMRPRSIGPTGSWVPYMMNPFVMIGPLFILCFFKGLFEHV